MKSKVENHADFSIIRYAQCWEDADILVEGLNIKDGDTVLSIGSAGDNTFALLAQNPKKVYALDLNPAQIACLEIRVAGYLNLNHHEFLELLGVYENNNRIELYNRIKGTLRKEIKAFWDGHLEDIAIGIGHAGKFERYFKSFREKVLPLVHSKKEIDRLLSSKDLEAREEFYNKKWNNKRWNLMFRIFFSRTVMGRLGRDPSFFWYVKGSVADRILSRTKYGLTKIDTATNPYLNWILKGNYGETLPFALRKENFELIKNNLHKLEYRLQSIEEFMEKENVKVDAYNLSDIFEYMSEDETKRMFELILEASNKGARLAYWNMLAPRKCPNELQDRIVYNENLSKELFSKDKAFFYSDFRIEEIL